MAATGTVSSMSRPGDDPAIATQTTLRGPARPCVTDTLNKTLVQQSPRASRAVRLLSPDDLHDFVDRHQATLREQHGHVLMDFAVVLAAVSDDVDG